MTPLRKRMLEELQRRNYSPTTIRAYLYAVEEFARYLGKSPDQVGQEHLREYQLHLLHDRKLTVGTIVGRIAALRFFFVKVLRRPYRQIDLIYPKQPQRLPAVLSQEEVAQLIDSANNLLDYTMLMTLYSTGMRRGNWRADKPLTPKCVWIAVQDAAKRSRIKKRVSPRKLSPSV